MQISVKNKGDLLRYIFSAITSVFTCVVGALFILQVWRIFSLGAQPFTREIVAKYFSQISVCVWLWIAILLINAVINAIFPAPVQKLRATVDEKTISYRLQNRLQPETAKSIVWKTEKSRFIVGFICACVCASTFIISIVLLLAEGYTPIATQGFFFQHQEAERLLVALPFVAVSCLSGVAYAYFQKATYKKEVSLLKEQMKSPQERVKVKENFLTALIGALKSVISIKPLNKKAVAGIRILLGVTAVAFIVWGIFNGGMQDVLEKAIVICKQCVGIG